MKKNLSLISAAALLLVQGCNVDEIRVQPQMPDAAPLRVRIYNEISQQPATKVAIDDGFVSGDEVGVYIVNYNGTEPGTLGLKDNQADNVRFKFDESGNWVSDYDVFYKDNDTKVDFYGYYPYATPSSIGEYPHEVQRDQTKPAEHGVMASYEASDFLWTKTANVVPTESRVILTFRHALSSARVRFSQGSGWESAQEYAAAKKEVLVTNTVRKSTIDLSTGAVTPVGEAPLSGIVPLNDHGDFRAIVVPQTVAAGKPVLTITVDGIPRNFVREVATEYLPGKMTTFDLTISKKSAGTGYDILLSGVSITVWEADNVSHSDDTREYVVVHNAVPGRLESTIVDRLEMDPAKIKNLKLTGAINATDYNYMRRNMPALQRLNLKEVESKFNGKYEIPSSAFSGKTTLSKCFLPDRLERIESDAFSGTALTGSLILPEGLKYVSGFQETKITSVQFPSTLEEIGSSAFSGCRSLMCEISLPQSLKEIGYRAFSSSAIKGNLVLPDNLEEIGSWAFAWCSSLTGSLVIPSKIKVISDYAFYDSGFSGTLTLPKGLVEIQSNAFNYTKFKGELYIPETVTTIGASAFSGTLFNGNLVLPSELVSLGSGVFSGCWRLGGVVELPKNIVSVPSSLFYGCRGIEGVVLHKDVEVIESEAFYNCYGITSITSKAKNPPVISSNSFNGVAKDNFTVEVPEASVTLYRNASNWSEFKRFSAHRDFSISRGTFRCLNAACSKDLLLRAPKGYVWKVESKPDWVSVTPSSGNADLNVAITKVDVSVRTQTLERGAGKREGEVVFLLEGTDNRVRLNVQQYDYQYGEGDVLSLRTATQGSGIDIVLLADCFDAKDISEGKYLSALQEASEYIFDIEPYRTYKDYFNVKAVFGVSPDSGMGTVNTIREARFGSQYTLNAGVSPDFNSVFEAAALATGSSDFGRTLIVLVENSTDYSGLTYMWGDGSAVSVIPMSNDPAPYDFRGLVHHEAGGHGFGKLADEYIYHNAFIQSCGCICCGHTAEVLSMQSCGFYDNISLTGSMHDVPWSHLIYDPQYSATVDVYEGAFFHTRGVFRSEPTSCMNNNIPYYNAISRESIVRRIKRYAGEEYSFEDFKAHDTESLPSATTKSVVRESYGISLSDSRQMPPKYMGEKPSFGKTN